VDKSQITVPYGYCHCGCGERTSLAPYTRADLGHVKGQPVRYRVGHANRMTAERRFWSLVTPNEGCWEWGGQRYSNGYGYLRGVEGPKAHLAHRFVRAQRRADSRGSPHSPQVSESCLRESRSS
jgi:hypothetical protein